ncbi:MAG: cobaltochelatase subunit CobN [Cyanobacteria bacterium K_Offshore_surface_m2_239]|nr:cobaltochelatase subunit CobN [Cyanobacteria bacterium K_Offshore_surface_m2_239]
MHRLATTANPGDLDGEGATFLSHPPATVVVLSSAPTDLLALEAVLRQRPSPLAASLRGVPLDALTHPAAIDHYIRDNLASTTVLLVRLLGGRGHWSYGLEQVRHWQRNGPNRQLLILAGTPEEEAILASLGSVPPPLAVALARCCRVGGGANLTLVVEALERLVEGVMPAPPSPVAEADPLPEDWRDDPGPRVGVVIYRALRQAGDLALMEALLAALRQRGLCPRALWVSGLRDPAVQAGVGDWFQKEGVQVVICATAFASVSFAEAGLGAPLWDRLDVPVLQLLTSGGSRERWQRGSSGLGPQDLSLQVALPELDGRLTTRVGAFRERVPAPADGLPAAEGLTTLQPDRSRLAWVVELAARWVALRQTPASERRLALVLANYPTRDGRLANGVGLDPPASAVILLQALAEEGVDLGAAGRPADAEALMGALLGGRTNDPESDHRPAMAGLPLATYLAWYAALPETGRKTLEAVWGPPERDAGLERGADGLVFPIRGLRFGAVALLIQPSRGYERDPSRTYHSPDLPPTHAYLAHYLWIREAHRAHAVVHLGKHGNLEWLPGKGVGLSDACFPEWALGPMPHLYPFIVNDPGEGSQAKRRSQAVILDHLTPPLGRAGLERELAGLEALLDEYWLARDLGSERVGALRTRLEAALETLRLPALAPAPARGPLTGAGAEDSLDARLEAADGYLCELKEAQIRLGLHIYGQRPREDDLAELLLAMARCPRGGQPGLTQALASDLGLDLDPWSQAEEDPLTLADRSRLRPWLNRDGASDEAGAGGAALRRVGDGVALLEREALALVRQQLGLETPSAPLTPGPALRDCLGWLRETLLPNLLACAPAEREGLLRGLAGRRVQAGPSGAPTRGRPEVLPTGRNFYSVDLRALPTEAAWDLGRRSAEQLLDQHRMEEGDDLRTLALSVWGTATMRNGGEDIAQALALMGVRPRWDGPTRRLVDVEVIAASALGRPRVDVTLRISGLFRDAFPQLVHWFNRACRLVAALPEEASVNPLAARSRAGEPWGRVYGSAPGAYGAGLQALIDSGQWEGREDLADAFLAWSGWRYDSAGMDLAADVVAVSDSEGLVQRLAAVQVVLHNQDNREHDLLDSDDYYQFQGGLSAAVERLSGQRPALWFGDHSRPQRPRVHRLEKELDKVIRSRLLNGRWLEGMRRHGYKGGFELAASLDYLFAYDASTGRVPDWSYGAICDRWLRGELLAFLRQANPWALRDMGERLLEAHHRGLWDGASAEQLDHLRQLVLSSEARIEQG